MNWTQMTKQYLARYFQIGALCLLLVVLIGPFFLLAYPIQKWASKMIWDAKERWDTVKSFAVFCLLLYLPLLLFRTQIIIFWLHYPHLGSPDLLDWRWRSFLSFELTPLAALLLERLHPVTHYSPRRTKRPVEPMPPLILTEEPPAGKSKRASSKTTRTIKAQQIKAAAPLSEAPAPSKIVAASPQREYDPRPLWVTLQEEQQRRRAGANRSTSPKKSSSPPREQDQSVSSPQPAPEPFNWDEGEGPYHSN